VILFQDGQHDVNITPPAVIHRDHDRLLRQCLALGQESKYLIRGYAAVALLGQTGYVLFKLLCRDCKNDFGARIARQSGLILDKTVVEQDGKAIAPEFP
jgi:hypothetical protein